MSRAEETTGVLWARVEEGFHVGSRDGDFVGFVDQLTSGVYRAFDYRAVEVGDFALLSEATRAVELRSVPNLDGVREGGA